MTSNKPRTAFASAFAALGSSRVSRRLYTGTNDAESVPSPSRFRTAFGILNAALYASEAAPDPKKYAKAVFRRSPTMRLSRMPAPTTNAERPPPASLMTTCAFRARATARATRTHLEAGATVRHRIARDTAGD